MEPGEVLKTEKTVSTASAQLMPRLSERTVSPRSHMEQERRLRREIANSNERRRMQSINAGFQSLRTLLPSHEGEKLSKAAILQQTAEYIYNLEQEKTRLLTQNCQLKRLLNQQEGESIQQQQQQQQQQVSMKRRRVLGELSLLDRITAEEPATVPDVDELAELRRQLERERRLRMKLEEKLFGIEGLIGYQTSSSSSSHEHHEEQTEEMEVPLPISESEMLPQAEVFLPSPPSQQQPSQPSTESHHQHHHHHQRHQLQLDVDECDGGGGGGGGGGMEQNEVLLKVEDMEQDAAGADVVDGLGGGATAAAVYRLPSVIEAALKAEPKVEVERMEGVDAVSASSGCLDVSSTSQKNLETIVEAIRHLEGDHLFSDDISPMQEAPLALTTKQQQLQQQHQQHHNATVQRLIKVDMSPFLSYHTGQSGVLQQRPGVIVVKHT